MNLLLLNKPFDVLCQFTDGAGRRTLADFVDVPGVYAAGRLDRDSEGLVLLTADGALQHRLSHPRHKLLKRYLVQVDGAIDEAAVRTLRVGVTLKDGPARAVEATRVEAPEWLWAREPPVRYRASIPTSWLTLALDEGRNRQVRRMTAAVGYPTLRLVRTAIGPYALDGLAPGAWRTAAPDAVTPLAPPSGRARGQEAPRDRSRARPGRGRPRPQRSRSTE